MKHAVLGIALVVAGCASDYVERPPPPANDGVYGFTNGCYVVDATLPGSSDTRWLVASPAGDAFSFSARTQDAGTRFRMRPSDLGTYLFRDDGGGYLVAQGSALARATTLQSDLELLDDTFRSPAEWELEPSASDPTRFQLHNYQTGEYLTPDGTTPDEAHAGVIAFYPGSISYMDGITDASD